MRRRGEATSGMPGVAGAVSPVIVGHLQRQTSGFGEQLLLTVIVLALTRT